MPGMRLKSALAFVIVLAVAVQLVACNDCGHPDRATYSNPPSPSGSPGCPGLPTNRGGNPGDADKTFPIGTVVRQPFCLGAYPGDTAFCTCEAGVLQFECPV
jgi:hypothetical protein